MEVELMISLNLSDELRGCDFGDARLNNRACEIIDALGEKPNVSIPAALSGRSDLEACYRLMRNQKVTSKKILQPHAEATYKRVETEDYVLIVQDTTEVEVTRPNQQVAGAGPMDCESRRGAFFHPMMAFSYAGVALGIVGHTIWTRDALKKMTDSQKAEERRKTRIEDKESFRWLEGLEAAKKTAQACPQTTCVCVGDSEADIYDLFVAHDQCNTANLQLLVRAGQNRNTVDKDDWKDRVRQSPKIATQCVSIRARTAKVNIKPTSRTASRKARTATIDIRKARIQLARPIHGSVKRPKYVTLNIVLCEETNPPKGEDPICWMLVTTLPIETDNDVQRVIQSYCIRWQIEVFFRTLKSGCRIESRRFETIGRISNCLAFLSIVAWRLMYISHIGRKCPDLDCEIIFEPSEWKSVYAMLGIKIPKKGCPTLNEVIRAIARLGGFIDRPKNEPGTQTLWIGLQRCYDLSNAWNLFGPGAKKISAD
jgi:Transposase Tn5 dimerisation domain/Transposase DNA-binding